MSSWITTALILLPVGAALAIWLLPWPRLAVGPIAIAVSLAEVGLWIAALSGFDFAKAGSLQYQERATWFGDLGVSYHVGFIGVGIWLAGLTVIAQAAAVVYALRQGRDRPRAYYGLMLFLAGSTVGVFSAQDLLLFYVFFEAMLIPLYVLIGVWGGQNARSATIKFVIYTMTGSLLMLVAIVALGLTQGTFDLTQMGTSGSVVMFLGFAIAFGIKAPIWPFHGWLPDAYRESPAEVSALLSES
jgi:NADH-quinone oxidoreductase subunit M